MQLRWFSACPVFRKTWTRLPALCTPHRVVHACHPSTGKRQKAQEFKVVLGLHGTLSKKEKRKKLSPPKEKKKSPRIWKELIMWIPVPPAFFVGLSRMFVAHSWRAR